MSNPQKKMKKMKKFLLSLGLVAMVLNLTNCAQYEDVNTSVKVKGNFELYASISRTANDGLNTVWSAKDEINVFHAEAGTTDYLNDTPYLEDATQQQNPFVCNDAAAGYFLGTLHGGELDATAAYDWYAFYPYSSYITTPANDGAGYSYIGCRSDKTQSQTGNDSMAHIAGSNYPMAGYAKNVAADAKPNLVFNHVASLVEFEVVNKLSEAITINEIAFTAEEDIVGAYYVNFAEENNYTFAKYNTYQSNTATLAVSNGAAIEAGASAKFYAAIKPFTAKSGSALSIVVSATSATGVVGAHEKAIALTSDVVFSAGKIKNVKVNYDTAFEVSDEVVVATVGFESSEGFTASTTYNNKDVKYFGATGKQWGTICGTAATNDAITGTQSMQMRVYKSTGPLAPYVFMNYTLPSVSKISFKAKTSDAKNTLKLSYKTTGDWVDVATLTLTTSAKVFEHEFDAALENVSFKFTFVYPSSYTDKSKIVIDEVVFMGLASTTPEVPATPVLSINPTTLSFEAAGGNKDVTCTIENEVSGVNVTATEDVDWLSTSVNGKVVTVTATENTATETRTATVTIAYEGAESKTVTVSQAAAEQGGNQGGEEPAEKVWTLVTEASTLAVGDQIIIAAKGSNVALSTTQNTNNRGQADITKSGDTLVNPSSSVQIITLEAGSVLGGFAFKVGSAGYLYAASNSSNYLKSKATKDANGSWSIAISTAGVATIKAQGSNGRNWLRYNSQSKLFSCYSSGQQDVVIYKLQ